MSHTFIRAFENRNKPILARNKPVERIHFNIVNPGEGHGVRRSDGPMASIESKRNYQNGVQKSS